MTLLRLTRGLADLAHVQVTASLNKRWAEESVTCVSLCETEGWVDWWRAERGSAWGVSGCIGGSRCVTWTSVLLLTSLPLTRSKKRVAALMV